MAQLQAEAEALRARASALENRAADAQLALDRAVAERQGLLLGSDDLDDTKIDKAQRSVDSASSKLAGLKDASSALRSQIADADAKLAAEREAVERLASAERLTPRSPRLRPSFRNGWTPRRRSSRR